MTNIERANRWDNIVNRLYIIEKTTKSFTTQMLARHYEKFAVEMMLAYCEKAVYGKDQPV